MSDFQNLVRQIVHLAGQQAQAHLTEVQRADNNTRLAEMAANQTPTRLYADPLILAAECAAIKARSRAKYGKNPHV